MLFDVSLELLTMATSQRLILATSLCFFCVISSVTARCPDGFLESLPLFPVVVSDEHTPTVHELLPKYGLPKGLIPNIVKTYSLSANGEFVIELEQQCYVEFKNLVFYDKKITGKLKYGAIENLSGIQAKKLFLWVPVTGIEADSDNNMIKFHVGFLSEDLPAEQFQKIPKCKSNACVEANPDEASSKISMV